MEARDGKPVSVRGTADEDEPGVLRIDFPGGAGNDRLEEISWGAWVQKFDENELAFLYQDKKADGELEYILQARKPGDCRGEEPGQQRRRQKEVAWDQMMQLKPIEQQVVVVVGASSGIGREAALRFARQGAKVVVAARSEAGLQSLVEEIQREGGEATAIAADVTSFADMQAVAERAATTYGRLDTWVHAAAVAVYATFEQTTPEEFRRVIEVNLVGQAHGAMAALPHLRREGRGALIHISSIEARRAFPYHSAYAASKHGIDGFLEVLRVELRREGVPIAVTNVMPAGINTPLFNKARTKLGVKPMPAPPIYQPNTVADLILYAAEHPTRDLIAGGAGRAFLLNQRLSPRLMDAIVTRFGFRVQETDEPKSVDAPTNLFAPIQGYDRVEGDFSDQALRRSLYNWLEMRPLLTRTAMLVTALGVLVRRAGRRGA